MDDDFNTPIAVAGTSTDSVDEDALVPGLTSSPLVLEAAFQAAGLHRMLVAHEMGHQHGGSHTFNGRGCPAGAWSSSTAWGLAISYRSSMRSASSGVVPRARGVHRS